MHIWQQRWFRWSLISLLFIWLTALYTQKTNLTASDLGRHLMNGKVILESGSVFTTNFYSFTHSDFAVPNHHWLFGVLAFFVYQVGGFQLLSIVGTMLSVSAVAIMCFGNRVFRRDTVLLSGVLFLLMPILVHRAEVRPEAVSLVFFSSLTILTWRWLRAQQGAPKSWKLATAWLIILPIWVNMHIFFIFGGLLLGLAGLQLIAQRRWVRLQQLLLIGSAAVGLSLINPVGLQALIYPFQIFDNYAYRVAENQSIWFFLQYYPQAYYFYLAALVGLFGVLAVSGWLRTKRSAELFPTLLLLTFCFLTALITRYESVFALTVIFWFGSVGWEQLSHLVRKLQTKIQDTLQTSLASLVVGALIIGWLSTANVLPIGPKFGVGLLPNNRASAAFFRTLEIEGNIFNNYDIGGFLIFELYPEHAVFVDNRPEAYPGDFMRDEHIAAQTDEDTWKKIAAKYDIGAIYFYRHDMTDWGQGFMIRRVTDEQWSPIYVDEYTLILVKNTPAHQEIIERFELPPETFVLPE